MEGSNFGIKRKLSDHNDGNYGSDGKQRVVYDPRSGVRLHLQLNDAARRLSGRTRKRMFD